MTISADLACGFIAGASLTLAVLAWPLWCQLARIRKELGEVWILARDLRRGFDALREEL